MSPRTVRLCDVTEFTLEIQDQRGHVATFPYSTPISQSDVCQLGVFGCTSSVPATFLETEWNPGPDNWNKKSLSLYHLPFELYVLA